MQRHSELCLHLHPLQGPLRRNTSGSPPHLCLMEETLPAELPERGVKHRRTEDTHALVSLLAGPCCYWPSVVTCEPSTTKSLQAVWNFPPGAVITAAGMVHPATVEASRGPGCLPRIDAPATGRCCRSQTTHSKHRRNLQGSLLDIFKDPGLSFPKKQLLLMAGSAVPGWLLG